MTNMFKAASIGDLKSIKETVDEVNARFGEQQAKEILGGIDATGRTMLHIAASKGQTPICRYLVETLKFDINGKDIQGYIPLYYAVVEGHYMTSSFLLDHGANPNKTSNKGKTPLHYAAKRGRKDQVKLLITKGAEVDALSSLSRGTPLRFAAAYSMKDALKILLVHKANPNYSSHPLLNPLILAIYEQSVDCVRLLLKHGADPNLGLHGEKPLFAAVTEGHKEIMKCLLRAGADPNVTNFRDLKPIEMAAVDGNRAIVIALFDVTARIPHIPTWSCDGIFEYINSQEAKNQRELKAETKLLEAQVNGAEAKRTNDYLTAVYWYTECMKMKQTDASVFSNRSFCFFHLNKPKLALHDANICITLRPYWFDGHYRAGIAYMMLKDYKNAVAAFGNACKYNPSSQELQDAYSAALAELQTPEYAFFAAD